MKYINHFEWILHVHPVTCTFSLSKYNQTKNTFKVNLYAVKAHRVIKNLANRSIALGGYTIDEIHPYSYTHLPQLSDTLEKSIKVELNIEIVQKIKNLVQRV